MTRKNVTIVSLCVTFLILILLATFFDLSISQKLSTLESGEYYSKNPFCVFFEIVGEMPIYILISASLGVLFYASKYNLSSSVNRKTAMVVLATLLVIDNFIAINKFQGYLSQHFNYFANMKVFLRLFNSFAFGLIIAFLWVFLLRKLAKDTVNRLIGWSFAVLATVFISQGLVQTLKQVLSRVRFRTMNYLGDFELFTRWFDKPNITNEAKVIMSEIAGNDAFRSFPSGHTASAAMTMFVPLLFDQRNQRLYKFKVLTFVLSIAYTVIVALSRIMIGAHFLSDVTFSFGLVALVAYLSTICVKKILAKISSKKESLSEETKL